MNRQQMIALMKRKLSDALDHYQELVNEAEMMEDLIEDYREQIEELEKVVIVTWKQRA